MQKTLNKQIFTLIQDRRAAAEHILQRQKLLEKEVVRFRNRLQRLGFLKDLANSKSRSLRSLGKMVNNTKSKSSKRGKKLT